MKTGQTILSQSYLTRHSSVTKSFVLHNSLVHGRRFHGCRRFIFSKNLQRLAVRYYAAAVDEEQTTTLPEVRIVGNCGLKQLGKAPLSTNFGVVVVSDPGVAASSAEPY
jgi:hypothetical protein